MIQKRVVLITGLFVFVCLMAGIYTFSSSNIERIGIPDQDLIFSEHKITYAGSHDIKLLNTKSLSVLDLGVKTDTYVNFVITDAEEISWIDKENINFFNPMTNQINKRPLPITGLRFKGRDLRISDFQIVSISPSGNKLAYLYPTGACLYIGGSPKLGKKDHSLGFRSELHVFDLVKNKDFLIVKDAVDWGVPQWSPNEGKILYLRPESDNYFDQSYLDRVVVNANVSWQGIIQSTVFVYDFNTRAVNKLCLGIYPKWSPDGNKIAFLTGDNNIGILDLSNMQKQEFRVKGSIDLSTFKLAWSLDQQFFAYLGKPKQALLRDLARLISGAWYERPLSMWIVKTDGTKNWYIGTRNIGDIRFVSKSFEKLLTGN